MKFQKKIRKTYWSDSQRNPPVALTDNLSRDFIKELLENLTDQFLVEFFIKFLEKFSEKLYEKNAGNI